MTWHNWNEPITISQDGPERIVPIRQISDERGGYRFGPEEVVPFLLDPCSSILADSVKTDIETQSEVARKERARRRNEKAELSREAWAVKHGAPA